MENANQIIVVSSPDSLPKGESHAVCIDALCRKYQLVILMCFGDEAYQLNRGYILPPNAHLIPYDYETIDASLAQVEKYLEGFGVGLVSRHNVDGRRLPFVFTGSVLKVPEGVDLAFFDEHDGSDVTKVRLDVPDAEWDL